MAWTLRTSSGRWKARYRAPDGKTRSRTFDRKRDADRWLRDQVGRSDRGAWLDPNAGRVTVEVMATRWLATRSHLAASTLDRDRSHLVNHVLPEFGGWPVAAVKPSAVGEWLAALDLASATRAKVLQIVSAVMDLAVSDQAIAANPCVGIPRPAQRSQRTGRALTDGELAAVIDAAERVDERTAAAVWLMGRAGLRIGEVLGLRRGDVDLDASRLRIGRSMSRREGVRPVKGRDGSRTIPLTADLRDRLARHLAQPVASIDGWLFTAPQRGRLRYENWRRRVWVRIVADAAIGDVRPHDLRHTVATRLFVVDGWTVPQVQAYLGHVDPTVTLRVYTHVKADELPRPSSMEVLHGSRGH